MYATLSLLFLATTTDADRQIWVFPEADGPTSSVITPEWKPPEKFAN